MSAIGAARLLNVKGCYIGAFFGEQNIGLPQFERLAGRRIAVNLTFRDYTEAFPAQEYRELAGRGTLPCVTHESWDRNPDNNLTYSLDNIIRGDFDSTLSQYASSVRDLGVPFLHRPFHEPNSFWYPWSGQPNGDAAGVEKLKAAWIHTHDIFRSAGAHNTVWCWTPNKDSVPNEPWNDSLKFYPGDDYVDVIGFDGYNWGDTQDWGSTWQSFEEIFGPAYAKFEKHLLNKPMMVGEFASTESGGNKAEWISNTFQAMRTSFPLVKIFNWFHINKETDWRIDSSPESLAAFREAVSHPYYLDIFN